METKMKRVVQDEDGATAVEYAIMAALIAAVIGTAVQSIGSTVYSMFLTAVSMFP